MGGLVSDIKTGAFSAKIAHAETRPFPDYPHPGVSAWRGSDEWILIEQDEVVGEKAAWQHQIGAEVRGQRIHEAFQQQFGKRIVAAHRSQQSIGARSDAASHQRDRPKVRAWFSRYAPKQVRCPDIESLHDPVHRLSRGEADILQNIVYMRLGNAALSGQPPLGQLAGLNSFPRNPDELIP